MKDNIRLLNVNLIYKDKRLMCKNKGCVFVISGVPHMRTCVLKLSE